MEGFGVGAHEAANLEPGEPEETSSELPSLRGVPGPAGGTQNPTGFDFFFFLRIIE